MTRETSIHAMRPMASGLFDRHPDLPMILGTFGEGLPFEHAARRSHPVLGPLRHASREIGDDLRDNTVITTSHNFRTPTLLSTMLEGESDRIMYSVDDPFEKHAHAATWFDACEISENDRRKIGRDNARRLSGLA